MRTIVDAAKAAGISAVIAADVAVMSYARQIGQEVHLSTQLNISNVELCVSMPNLPMWWCWRAN